MRQNRSVGHEVDKVTSRHITTTASANVLIVGGDVIVGQALELLLQNADYSVRFLGEPSLDEPGLLDGFQLLLIAPGLSAKCHEALLALLNSTTVAERIPFLELVCNVEETQAEAGHLVPWPCQPEELERRIKAALLLDGSKTEQDDVVVVVSQEDGQYSQTRQDEAREHRGLNAG